MKLQEKINKWAELKKELDSLENEIKSEVLLLKTSILTETANVKYSKGKGEYDYQSIVSELSPSDLIMEKHTKFVVDYKAISEELKASEDLKKKYYTTGNPTCSIKLLNG